MKNRYFKIFGLATGMFFLSNAEGMNENHSYESMLDNFVEVNEENSNADATSETEPFYENSPLVRNYVSEYEEKLRDLNRSNRTACISGLIVRTYFRLLETTTLDQQGPLFAKWEALALMLIQTRFSGVQSVHQLLDDECYQRLTEPFLKVVKAACVKDARGLIMSGWVCPFTKVFKIDLEYFEIARRVCLTLVSLQDLFMGSLDSKADFIAERYYQLRIQLEKWKEGEQHYENYQNVWGFGRDCNLSKYLTVSAELTYTFGHRRAFDTSEDNDKIPNIPCCGIQPIVPHLGKYSCERWNSIVYRCPQNSNRSFESNVAELFYENSIARDNIVGSDATLPEQRPEGK